MAYEAAVNTIASENGGKRNRLGERWDRLPGGWQALAEVSRVAHDGEEQWGFENWKSMDPESEQSPLNHALAHAYKSLEFPAGSVGRVRQLAKAAWNLLAQIWFEKRMARLDQAIEEVENAGQKEEAASPEPAPSSALSKLLGKVTGN